MINFVFFKVGDLTNLNESIASFTNGQYDSLSLQFILGYSLAPLMWLLGVESQDITLVGQIMGEKVIMTEFIGYISLAELKDAGAFMSQNPSSWVHICCVDLQFCIIGIQIGGMVH